MPTATAARRRPAPSRAQRKSSRAPRKSSRAPQRRPRGWQPSRALAGARSSRRLVCMLAGYLLLTALIGTRLVQVQVLAAEEYRGLGEQQSEREVALLARRGTLYDRTGQPLALSQQAAAVYAHPRLLREKDVDVAALARKLAPLLQRDAAELTELLTRDTTFVYLARQVDRTLGEQVRVLKLPGVGVLEEPRREYPAGALAAQVIGFAGVQHVGLSGLELQHDVLLAGTPGRLWFERAPGGVMIGAVPREVQPPVSGTDLMLTLDRQVQHMAEEVLRGAVSRYSAKGASAIVLDPRNGQILAMASAPTPNGGNDGDIDWYARRNRAVTDIFEAGSVNKVVTAAAALDSGLVRRDEVFSVPYEYEVGGKMFRDLTFRRTEQWNVAEIMAASSNVGAIMMAERVGEQRLEDYLRRFGYGQRTGVGFPGEVPGLVPPAESWSGTSLPTIAIGHGVSSTLLQVANLFGTVANGGKRLRPTLVRGAVGEDGELEPWSSRAPSRAIGEETAQALSQMLTGVVERGTGQQAAVPGYSVAGKTGTAQKAKEGAPGYAEGKYIATFAGFAPASDPALVVAVMVDEPTPIYGGETAAPIFSEIMQFALHHRRTLPDSADSGATHERSG